MDFAKSVDQERKRKAARRSSRGIQPCQGTIESSDDGTIQPSEATVADWLGMTTRKVASPVDEEAMEISLESRETRQGCGR